MAWIAGSGNGGIDTRPRRQSQSRAALLSLFDDRRHAHRTRKDHSPANLGLIRRIALNLLQQDTSNKWSIRRRKMRSLSDLPYRESLLFRTTAARTS